MTKHLVQILEAIAMGTALIIIMSIVIKILAILYMVETGEIINIILTLIKTIPGTMQ